MKIYLLDFNGVQEEYELIKPLLSEQRLSYCEGKKNLINRLSSAYAYALLRYAIKTGTGESFVPVFDYNEHGKPFIKGSTLKFSISHSENTVICALSEEEIGADIQYIRPISLRAVEKFCTEDELKMVISSEDRDRESCRIWCIKESRGKLTGKGFQEGFRDISADSLIKNNEAVCLPYRNGFISACGYKDKLDGNIDILEITAEKLLSSL